MKIIYKITNLKNGKFYIGKTSNLKRRWKEHLSLVGKKRHPLYDAILHYGVENFIMEVVDKVDDSLVDSLEKDWIKKTKAREIGYNIAYGGEGGDTFSNRSDNSKDITRKKLRNYLLKNNPMYDKSTKEKHQNVVSSLEYRKKMSKIVKSRDDGYRDKVSKGLKKTLQNSEMRQKWSECKRGSKNGRWIGYVISTDLNGNETIYESSKEAGKVLKMDSANIRSHCKNNTSPKVGIYKGWKFRFENG